MEGGETNGEGTDITMAGDADSGEGRLEGPKGEAMEGWP